MFWNKKKPKPLVKDPTYNEEEGIMNFQTLTFHGDQWMRIDDVITWLKLNQKINGDPKYHFLIREIIKMKHQ